MSVISFGSGKLFGCRTDVANATPVQFGVLQDVSVEFSATLKELYGGSRTACRSRRKSRSWSTPCLPQRQARRA